MNFKINLGSWNSVFAVPSDVVDKHIKLAGSAQLKVLLWVLRHAGEDFSVEDISSALSMHKADVKDSMQYWIENNLVVVEDCQISPSGQNSDTRKNTSHPREELTEKNECPKSRPMSRHPKLDTDYVAKRIEESDEIKFLMQEAEIILSRPISNGDASAFITFHDVDGLPIDVIIMLLQYTVSIGKSNIRYIEKVAMAWGAEGIDSVEKVEQKIKQLTRHKEAWTTVEKIVGLEHRSPSAKEDEIANRWINEWHIKKELINEAYERCVNAKGKFIPSYMDSIIKRWKANGITTISQAVEERKSSPLKNNKGYSSYSPSYDIDEYENSSIFD